MKTFKDLKDIKKKVEQLNEIQSPNKTRILESIEKKQSAKDVKK